MNKFVLKRIEPESDNIFLDDCEISFSIYSRNDMFYNDADGARILQSTDMVIFDVQSDEDCVALKLRFGDRVRDYLSWE